MFHNAVTNIWQANIISATANHAVGEVFRNLGSDKAFKIVELTIFMQLVKNINSRFSYVTHFML